MTSRVPLKQEEVSCGSCLSQEMLKVNLCMSFSNSVRAIFSSQSAVTLVIPMCVAQATAYNVYNAMQAH